MNKDEIIRVSADFTNSSPRNRIDSNIALSDDVIGLKMYEEPIFGFGPANDEAYLVLKEANIVGEHFRLPGAWLSNAKSVISFFPFYKASAPKQCSGHASTFKRVAPCPD